MGNNESHEVYKINHKNFIHDVCYHLQSHGTSLICGTEVLELSPYTLQLLYNLVSNTELKVLNSNECVSVYPHNQWRQLRDNHQAFQWDVTTIHNLLSKLPYLKVSNSLQRTIQGFVDLGLYRGLTSLYLEDISIHLVLQLRILRPLLSHLVARGCIDNCCTLIEQCGADRAFPGPWNRLTFLDLSHNNLVAVDYCLRLLPELKTLDLSFNSIKNIEGLFHLKSLEHINLCHNQLVKLPTTISDDNNSALLKVLLLSHNFLDEIEGLEVWHGLQVLDLRENCLGCHNSCNEIKQDVMEFLKPLKFLRRLQRLWLSDNPLSYVKDFRLRVASCISHLVPSNFQLDDLHLDPRHNHLPTVNYSAAVDVVPRRTASIGVVSENRPASPCVPTKITLDTEEFDDTPIVIRKPKRPLPTFLNESGVDADTETSDADPHPSAMLNNSLQLRDHMNELKRRYGPNYLVVANVELTQQINLMEDEVTDAIPVSASQSSELIQTNVLESIPKVESSSSELLDASKEELEASSLYPDVAKLDVKASNDDECGTSEYFLGKEIVKNAPIMLGLSSTHIFMRDGNGELLSSQRLSTLAALKSDKDGLQLFDSKGKALFHVRFEESELNALMNRLKNLVGNDDFQCLRCKFVFPKNTSHRSLLVQDDEVEVLHQLEETFGCPKCCALLIVPYSPPQSKSIVSLSSASELKSQTLATTQEQSSITTSVQARRISLQSNFLPEALTKSAPSNLFHEQCTNINSSSTTSAEAYNFCFESVVKDIDDDTPSNNTNDFSMSIYDSSKIYDSTVDKLPLPSLATSVVSCAESFQAVISTEERSAEDGTSCNQNDLSPKQCVFTVGSAASSFLDQSSLLLGSKIRDWPNEQDSDMMSETNSDDLSDINSSCTRSQSSYSNDECSVELLYGFVKFYLEDCTVIDHHLKLYFELELLEQYMEEARFVIKCPILAANEKLEQLEDRLLVGTNQRWIWLSYAPQLTAGQSLGHKMTSRFRLQWASMKAVYCGPGAQWLIVEECSGNSLQRHVLATRSVTKSNSLLRALEISLEWPSSKISMVFEEEETRLKDLVKWALSTLSSVVRNEEQDSTACSSMKPSLWLCVNKNNDKRLPRRLINRRRKTKQMDLITEGIIAEPGGWCALFATNDMLFLLRVDLLAERDFGRNNSTFEVLKCNQLCDLEMITCSPSNLQVTLHFALESLSRRMTESSPHSSLSTEWHLIMSHKSELIALQDLLRPSWEAIFFVPLPVKVL